MSVLYVVCDRLPGGPDSEARFIELEDEDGASHGADVGVEWSEHPAGGMVRLGPFRAPADPQRWAQIRVEAIDDRHATCAVVVDGEVVGHLPLMGYRYEKDVRADPRLVLTLPVEAPDRMETIDLKVAAKPVELETWRPERLFPPPASEG